MVQKLSWLCFSLTIFLGAFLMFLIEPVTGKLVTPQFGGTASVWCMCLLFFQAVLLGGYTLTYGLSKLPPAKQGILYAAIMLLSVFLVHIPTGKAWAPAVAGNPVQNLLLLLTTYLALPCVLLSSISGLFQHWFRLSGLGNPYPLYSISNVGSLGALLAYPTLVEPNLTLPNTLTLWTWLYWLLVVVALVGISVMLKRHRHQQPDTTSSVELASSKPFSIPWRLALAWIVLSTAGSVLLLAFTSMMTHDIAPVPLLWVIPLSVYLLTFILCFSQKPFYNRAVYVGLGQLLLVLYLFKGMLPILPHMLFVLVLLFVLCMICHGELVARKPDPAKLPLFYWMMAFGGMLGGVFVNLLAPGLFSDYTELPLILIAMAVFTVYLGIRYPVDLNRWVWMHRLNRVVVLSLTLLFAVGYVFFKPKENTITQVLQKTRNFYGIAKVWTSQTAQFKGVFNGTILHGGQYLDPARKQIPLTYYHAQTAFPLVAQLMRERRQERPLQIGAIGLGTGSIATYAKPGDTYTFYEIDPKMKAIAERDFSFLQDSSAKLQIVMGDGRLSLEKEPSRHYDILLVDAFNGDSIPVHLLTREAVQAYLRQLKPDGVLLFHVSNKYLNLSPVISNQGLAVKLSVVCLNTRQQDEKRFFSNPSYVAITPNPWLSDALKQPTIKKSFPDIEITTPKWVSSVGRWTDDYSYLLGSFLTGPGR